MTPTPDSTPSAPADYWVTQRRQAWERWLATHGPDIGVNARGFRADFNAGWNARAEAEAAQRQHGGEAALRSALEECFVVLEGMRLAVRWELAPAVRDSVTAAAARAEQTLAAPQQEQA